MTGFERWDVLTALFPFTDTPIRKPRPVLVLSSQAFNAGHGHIIGCMVTTGAGSSWPSDHPIIDLTATGLTHRSVVRWKVFTLPLRLIGRQIGSLAAVDREAVVSSRQAILS
jgi:mRNA interferase MazF